MSATLVLTRQHIRQLMSPADWLDAVRRGFAALGEGRVVMPMPMHLEGEHGSFHAKAASLQGSRTCVALKFNANLPGNPQRHGLPTIRGAMLLMDADDGALLAVLDSVELTLRRTAAATALAASHLARTDARVLTLCGCGAQALPQLEALLQVLPLRQVWLHDQNPAAAQRLHVELASRQGLQVAVAPRLADATRLSDVIVTCTPSRTPFLGPGHIPPGCFIAAVGADNPSKSEIEPALAAASRVVVDSLRQCLQMGDLHHAVEAGAMRAEQVHAELSELVLGSKPGRTSAEQIWVFDSTGVAAQDVASAVRVFELAQARHIGLPVNLGDPQERSDVAVLQ